MDIKQKNEIRFGSNDNISKKYADLRDKWFGTSELHYTEKLLDAEEYHDFVKYVQTGSSTKRLYNLARYTMQMVDDGEIKTELDAKCCEMIISACLLRGDFVKEKVLEKTPGEDFVDVLKYLKHQISYSQLQERQQERENNKGGRAR